MSASVKPKLKPGQPRDPRNAPKNAALESDAAKLRRANEMLDQLLIESKALYLRAAETSARLARSLDKGA